MIEGALEADGRIAAKNAVKIRAALRELADYKQLFLQYQETQPVSTDNLAKDRARSRAWAIMNVTQLRTEALESALWRMWAEAYVLGDVAASEWLRKTRELSKADDAGYVDWANWKPGDRAASLMLRRPKAFQQILDQTGASIRGMTKTSITDIGNALAEAVELGLDAERAALLISRHVASPARALTIAITEQNRVMSAATIARYKEAELEKMEWHVSDPCAKCAQNAGVEVPIGTSFPSGNTQPPAHPHCRCVLLPVIPGMDETPEMPGATTVVPPSPVDFGPDAATAPAPKSEEWSSGAWVALSRPEIRTAIIDRYVAGNPKRTREEIADYVDRGRIDKADLALLRSGTIVKNGPIEVQFYSTGAKLPEATKQNVLKIIDKLQETNPKKKAVLAIGSESSSKRGWALLGGERLWITPKTARFMDTNAPDVGFKMPVLGKVSQVEYTLAHEWGHLIDEGGGFGKGGVSFQAPETIAKINELKKQFPDAFKSSYSAENTKEFYAEMFTEYFNSGGLTDNPLVQAMAKEFKWKAPDVPKPKLAYVPAKNNPDYYLADIEAAEDRIKGYIPTKIREKDGAVIPDWTAASGGSGPENIQLKNLMRDQGFLGKPRIVEPGEFQKIVDGGAVPIYRGMGAQTKEEIEDYTARLLTGDDPFIGRGFFGDGTYFASDRGIAQRFSEQNAGGDIDFKFGEVLEGVLDPQAKVIDIEDLWKLRDEYVEKMPYHGDLAQAYEDDIGLFATTQGFDAIVNKNPMIGYTPDGQRRYAPGSYYTILNRTALIMKGKP